MESQLCFIARTFSLQTGQTTEEERERETTAIEMPTILGSSAVAFIVGFIVGWRAICGSSSPALLLWFASMSVKQTAARF